MQFQLHGNQGQGENQWDRTPQSKAAGGNQIFTPESSNKDQKSPENIVNSSNFEPQNFSSVPQNINIYNSTGEFQASNGGFDDPTPMSIKQNISPSNASRNIMSPTNAEQATNLRRDMSADKLLNIKNKSRFNPLSMEFGGTQIGSMDLPNKRFGDLNNVQAQYPKTQTALPPRDSGYAGNFNQQTALNFTSPQHGIRSSEYNPLYTTFGQQGTAGSIKPQLVRQGSYTGVGNMASPPAYTSHNPTPSNRQNPLQQGFIVGQQGQDQRNPLMRIPTFERRIEAPRKKPSEY